MVKKIFGIYNFFVPVTKLFGTMPIPKITIFKKLISGTNFIFLNLEEQWRLRKSIKQSYDLITKLFV
uniref:Uncharacterized protein n=1 Tax=Strongyloides stercoralis TaxID=6248 RepID=A0A0K0EPE7_STRER